MQDNELSAAKRLLLARRMLGVASAVEDDEVKARIPGVRLPLSVEQHRIWLHAAMEPELPVYNESISIRKQGDFSLELLEASFNVILDRHEIWRTRFEVQEGELVQVIHPHLQVKLPLVDLTALPSEKREAEAVRLATEAALKPIDLSVAPLFRVRVVRLSGSDHRLQMTLHHIIFDGVSIHSVFVPELAATYAALAAGRSSALPAPILQYGDYTLWRERQLHTPAMAGHLDFWRRELSGELPILRLPVDRPRPAKLSHRGSVEYITFPADLQDEIRLLSRQHGVSSYMVLLAALKTLLFRYSEQEDVVVGGLCDGRRRPELEGLMGYFLDTFAIRTRPSASLTFLDYLKQVRHTVLAALEAAHEPFGRVVQAVCHHRDPSHHPIMQTFFAFQPQGSVFPEGWEIFRAPVDNGTTKFDLYIEVEERARQSLGRIVYNTELFDPVTIQRLADHWLTLLGGIVRNPYAKLGELPLLTDAEQALMLDQWNQHLAPYPDSSLPALVRAKASSKPRETAVQYEGRSLSYAELQRQTSLLAAHLQAAGAAPGTLVAIFLHRSEHLPVTLLAALTTGAAYLPLDPAVPAARTLLCLEDAEPAVLLTQRSLLKELPHSGASIVILEDALSTRAPRSFTPVSVPLDSLAYVIYTSGSTGRPKGVEIQHRSLINLLASMQLRPGFESSDTLLAMTTVSFDIAALELFLPLMTGGRLVMVSRETAQDAYLLIDAIQQSACTVLQATPATWRGLLALGWQGRPNLRILCGGEALTRSLAQGLLEVAAEVWNVYGPTETTIWSTLHRVTPGLGAVSAGRPIANTSTFILDRQLQPVPIGVAGELWIGGVGLARGYRNRPKLTSEKFVSFPALDDQRLYRTGDSAIYRADGSIEIQGRADNQVKIRGYRIELEDVEAAMSAHPQVLAAAARAWSDPSGGNTLCAYLVGVHGAPPPHADEFRRFLKTCLPDYMIPSVIVSLDSMPCTANGKLDRKALARPELTRVPASGLSSIPTSERELKLARIWSELLGAGAIGMQEDFFALGGHSLLVARLQQRIAQEFGLHFSMASLFHAPTIARQIELMDNRHTAHDPGHILPIQPRGSRPPLFWLQPPPRLDRLAENLDPDQPVLGVTMTLQDLKQLGPQPDLEAFGGCFAETILRAQPYGPWYLGGFCTGGALAFATSVALERSGQPVTSLILLSSENPAFYRRFGSLSTEFSKILFYSHRALRKDGLGRLVSRFKTRIARLLRRLQPEVTEMSRIENSILRAALRYHPPIYHGNVLLLHPEERPAVVDYFPGWKTVVAGKVECVDVNGQHDELFTPALAPGVAAAVSTALQRVTRAPAPALQPVQEGKVFESAGSLAMHH